MTLKNIFEFNLIQTDKFTLAIIDLIGIVIIITITKIILSLLKKIFNRQVRNKKMDLGSSQAIYQIIRYFVWIIAIMLVLETSGLEITILLASSAALLVGIGLGLQEVFKDLISGLFMLFEGTLKVEDIVELQGGIVGRVKQIGFRTTKIETRDRVILIVPNSKFISDRLINWSHLEKKTRFHVNVGVAYGSDVEKVTKILLEAAEEHMKIAKDPKPVVMFTDFGESSLDFKIHFWTANTFWVEIIKSDLRYSINRKFIENNVTIPFPQRDVHIRTNVSG